MGYTLAVLIVLVILIVVWCFYHWYSTGEMPDAWAYRLYQNAKRRVVPPPQKPLELFNQTQGYAFDETASTALDRALKEEETYRNAEQEGELPPTAASDAIVNSWVLANLYRFHVRPNYPTQREAADDLATSYYLRTLDRIHRYPQAAVQAPVAPERILERAPLFTLPPPPAKPEEEEAPALQAALFEQIRLQRLQTDYYAPRPVAADPQNVHDTQVQHGSGRIFARIRQLNALSAPPIAPPTAREAVRQAATKSKKATPALYTLSRMDDKHQLDALHATESEVLTEVWRRVNDPANTQNREALVTALVDALADSAIMVNDSPSGTVCSSGRCNRMLGAFTLLDADAEVAAPVKTVEILRNEVLSKTQLLLNTTLQERGLLAEYERGEEGPDVQNALEEVREKVRGLAAEYPSAKPETLQSVLADALTGVA